MRYGHSPEEIAEYPWAEIENFLNALPAIQARENPFAGES